MSSFKNFAPTLTSLQAQADGTGTIAGSPIEDFLSIAGYEEPAGGGGGGGGDFSTAQVTLINNTTAINPVTIVCAITLDDDEDDIHASSGSGLYATVGNSDTQNVILYKGVAHAYEGVTDDSNSFSVTGNIELDDDGFFTITGDGTITATDGPGA